ncbi:DNA-binding protein [Streptomyces sp. NBC_01483]|uniref:DNA-binding protein n=1 Tax=Streptomyces sp. NBC_01483 TaxID=2903883 RepID=UPI002E319133|nr:DNA-binding protein [Streptomyces sp. NBC_01483]
MAGLRPDGAPHPAGIFRTAPFPGETTSSLLSRLAHRYGLEEKALRSCWQWRNYPPRHENGSARADAEMLLNAAGRRLLSHLCGVEQDVLARALPSWGQEDAKLPAAPDAGPAAAWRIGGALAGPVAFGCRLCTARRTGTAVQVMRYAARRQRVCARHGRWLLDADAGQPLEHLDLRGVPEVVAAQRQWATVARRAVRAGAQPERVFALAHAVVARWWEQALHWQQETIWPRRLHHLAGGNAGDKVDWWRIVGRDAAVFPEIVAVAGALLDPAMAQLAWIDSGAGRPRPLPADGMFCHRLGERVDRPWLGPLAATDYGSPLTSWMGAVIRMRRSAGGPPGYDNDPWWLRQEHQAATMAGQLRVMAAEAQAGGSGTRWRATVSAEHRFRITRLLDEAREELAQLRGAQSGTTAEVARTLLEHLSQSAELIDRAVLHTAAAAVAAGVALEEVAQWSRLPAEELSQILAAGRSED